MHTLAQDLRYALRNLRRNRAFTAVALTALAIGIGANTAVFTVVESVLLRPLPYRNPSQLYSVRPTPKQPTPFGVGAMSDPQFLACRSATKAFQQLAAYNFSNWNGTGIGDPVPIHGQQVTANFFATLGIQPQSGRGFLPEEETPAGPRQSRSPGRRFLARALPGRPRRPGQIDRSGWRALHHRRRHAGRIPARQ